MSNKNIQVGQYWNVKYRNYTGPVLVKEIKIPYEGTLLEREPEYYCDIAEDIYKDKPNKYGKSMFLKRDFRKQTTLNEFLQHQLRFMLKNIEKINKKLDVHNG